MARRPKREEGHEINSSKVRVINEVLYTHFQFPPRSPEKVRDASKSAMRCLHEVAGVFCNYYCDRTRCNVGTDGAYDVAAVRKMANAGKDARYRKWRDAQEALHRSLSYLSACRDVVPGCPACAVVKALSYFPKLVLHSPVPPISKETLIRFGRSPDDPLIGNGRRSVPCCVVETQYAEGGRIEVFENVQVGALLRLDLERLPEMPVRDLARVSRAIIGARKIIETVFVLSQSDDSSVNDLKQASMGIAMKPAIKNAGAPSRLLFSMPPRATWSELSIKFMDGYTVRITVRGKSMICNYTDMGMKNNKNGNPTVQWKLLRSFADGNGTLDWQSKAADRRRQKQREILAKNLMQFFQLDIDPVRLTEDRKGWETRFKISPED